MRTAAAVVIGYVVMAVGIAVLFSLAYVAMGADGAFRAGTYDVSTPWIVMSLVVSFLMALAGGWTARRIDRDVRGPRVLAGVIIVLGLIMLIPTLTGGAELTGVREGAPAMSEAMRLARTPLWITLANIVLGAAGVLVGGDALGRHAREQPLQPAA